MRTHYFLALLALFFLANPAARAQNSNSMPRMATVLRVEGKARYSTDEKSWHSVKRGSVLGSGSIIQVGENSTVDLRLEDRSAQTPAMQGQGAITLIENSVLAIEELAGVLQTNGNTSKVIELDLRAGQIFGAAAHQAPDDRYEIKFPGGLAGIRGGSYRVTASGIVEAKTDKIVVALMGADGTAITKIIPPGHCLNPGIWTISDVPPDEPKTPSPAPEPAAPAQNTHAKPPSTGSGLGGSLRKF